MTGLWTLLLLQGDALAWECHKNAGCNTCAYQVGNAREYRINTNDFTLAQVLEIKDAAHAWDAGAGLIVRGADWDWYPNDVLFDGTLGNGNNNVRKKSAQWFEDQGYGTKVAITRRWQSGCDTVEADITFNLLYTFNTDLPSTETGPVDDFSIGQVTIHEFGHALGFRHENAFEATMNEDYPGGGDIAGSWYRIHENDYVGLVHAKGDSSTGKTLMLSKFIATALGDVGEAWTDDGAVESGRVWTGCPGDNISQATGPREILALIVGTPTVTPKIEWALDPGGVCFSGTEYSLGTRNPTISANTPYAVQPNGGYAIPNNTPVGDYHLCAKINSDGAIAESSSTDNIVRSEKIFEVESGCP